MPGALALALDPAVPDSRRCHGTVMLVPHASAVSALRECGEDAGSRALGAGRQIEFADPWFQAWFITSAWRWAADMCDMATARLACYVVCGPSSARRPGDATGT